MVAEGPTNEQKTQKGYPRSEVLRDARVACWRVVGRVLNPRVPPGRYILHDGLAVEVRVVRLIIAVVGIVVLGVVLHVAVFRAVRPSCARVGRGGVGRPTVNVRLAFVADGRPAKRANAFRIHRLPAVHQWVSRIGCAGVRGRAGAVVSSRLAARVGEGSQSAGNGRGSLAVRRVGGVAPATVPAGILRHFRAVTTNSGKRGVVVRVEAILLDLLPPILLGNLPLLSLPPEKYTGRNEQSDDNNRDNDSNGGLSARREAAAVIRTTATGLERRAFRVGCSSRVAAGRAGGVRNAGSSDSDNDRASAGTGAGSRLRNYRGVDGSARGSRGGPGSRGLGRFA